MHLIRTRSGARTRTKRRMGVVGLLLIIALATSGAPNAASAAPGDPVLYEQTDSRLAYSGGWTAYAASALSGGSHALTNSPGAAVNIAFVGTRLELVGMTGPKSGILAISIDGGAADNIDLYGADTLFQQTVYTSADLPNALHIATVRCVGAKNAASGDTFVGIDAVRVSGMLTGMPVEQSDSRIVRRGTWATYSTSGLSGGSHMMTNTAGNQVAVAFVGTCLDLVGMTGPKFGIAAVSVDGGAPVDVDLYSADTRARQLIYSTGDLPSGAHTVLITCTGRRRDAATDSFIDLDAALATGALVQATMRYDDTDPRLAWAGQTSGGYAPDYVGGRFLWAGQSWGAGAVSFVGSRMEWVGVVGPQYGIASVVVDGGAPQYVDLYSPTVQTKKIVYGTGDLPWAQHTVTIGWTGRKNDAATGTYISYDAFDIGGDIVQAAPPVQPAFSAFNYPWNRYIVVDKSDLRLYYVVNGALVATYPVATGKATTQTPNAVWRIDAKYYTDPSSVYGPRKMRLFRQQGNSYVFTAYGIHGTNNDSSISTYASHGCIRLHNYDILVLFDMVPLGTMVVTRD